MNFDLISSALLSASAAIVGFTLVRIFARTLSQRIAATAALVLWFAAVLTAGATGLLGPAGPLGPAALGLAVLIPVLLLSFVSLRSEQGRKAILETPLPVLISTHAMRSLGIIFILLYTAGRLPAPFAPSAGWGDVFIGVTALPLAWLISHDRGYSLLWIWNTLGGLDLVSAIGLGATSSPGPIQIFHTTPNSALMTTLPFILIPCFIVPLLALLHIITFYRLRHLSSRTTVSPARVAAVKSST
jgi:hypothetical protein